VICRLRASARENWLGGITGSAGGELSAWRSRLARSIDRERRFVADEGLIHARQAGLSELFGQP
jgi:hypothetical protein